MSSLMFASAEALGDMTVSFPNLFGGMEISYRRGFSIFGFNIYWYGVIIAVGVVLAYIYAMRRVTRDFGLVKNRVFDVVFVTIIGAFLCARIYYCVFINLNPNTPDTEKYNFITMFTRMRDGGIAIYGGIIGAVLIGLLMCKLRKVNFFAMADLAALGFLIGQSLGRWGNFINQEAYGAACDKNWLFAMTGNRITAEMGSGVCVHPCFLYESVWCLLGFILLHFYSKKLRTFDGEIALLYVAWYGFERFFVEQLRTDSLYWGPFKVSQWVGAFSFVAAMVCFVICKVKTSKSGKPLYVNSEASKLLIESDRQAELERKSKKDKKAESIIADETNKTYDITEEDNSAENDNLSEQPDEITDTSVGEDTTEDTVEVSAENTSEEKENEDGGEDNRRKSDFGGCERTGSRRNRTR